MLDFSTQGKEMIANKLGAFNLEKMVRASKREDTIISP